MAGKILREYARGRATYENVSRGRKITERETEILQLVVEGLGNKEIAHRLSISESTVRNHLHNILDKLHLQNRVQLAMYASRQGIVGRGNLSSSAGAS
jgi:DNA-binding NarL/FixJ family response regulator